MHHSIMKVSTDVCLLRIVIHNSENSESTQQYKCVGKYFRFLLSLYLFYPLICCYVRDRHRTSINVAPSIDCKS